MPNILVRDVPTEDLAQIEKHATALGLSRNEYILRKLHQDAHRGSGRLTMKDFEQLSELAQDLGDEEIMRKAWE